MSGIQLQLTFMSRPVMAVIFNEKNKPLFVNVPSRLSLIGTVSLTLIANSLQSKAFHTVASNTRPAPMCPSTASPPAPSPQRPRGALPSLRLQHWGSSNYAVVWLRPSSYTAVPMRPSCCSSGKRYFSSQSAEPQQHPCHSFLPPQLTWETKSLLWLMGVNLPGHASENSKYWTTRPSRLFELSLLKSNVLE